MEWNISGRRLSYSKDREFQLSSNKRYFLLLLIPVLFLFPGINGIPYSKESEYSDFAITHLPNALFIQQSIRDDHQIPLWNPHILSGYPFNADPLSGLHYLPNWMVVFLPLPLGLNLLVVIHLLFGAWGMLLLLKQKGVDELYALLGAILFETVPKIYGHLGNGHITMVMAVMWTPWLFYFEGDRLRNFCCTLRKFASSLVFFMVITADIRWAVYLGGIWFLLVIDSIIKKNFKNWKNILSNFLLKVSLAVALSAGFLLPFGQYVFLSTRILMQPGDMMTLSLPFVRLITLVYPDIGGFGEWQIYYGVVAIFLILSVLINPRTRKRAFWGVGLLAMGLFWSTGEYSGVDHLVGSLPFFSFLRVPPRILNFTGLLSGYFLIIFVNDFKNNPNPQPWLKKTNLLLFSFSLIGIFVGVYLLIYAENRTINGFLWTGICFGILLIGILLLSRKILSDRGWVMFLIAMTIVDTGLLNLNSVIYRPLSYSSTPDTIILQSLINFEKSPVFRMYSPSYSIRQENILKERSFHADGVNPIQLLKYAKYFEKASGVPYEKYSVSLPPFSSGNPKTDNVNNSPDIELLSMLNVRYLVSDYPIKSQELLLSYQYENKYVYSNPFAYPHVWYEQENPSDENAPQILLHSPNRITVKSTRGGRLILSEVNYPGWQVYIDGKKLNVIEYHELFRSVWVPQGDHIVDFIFEPLLFFGGLGISLITLVIILMKCLMEKKCL